MTSASISFSETTATLNTNATVTFTYTQSLDVNDTVTIYLPDWNTNETQVFSNTSCHFSTIGVGGYIDLTVEGSKIPANTQCIVVLHGIINPSSAKPSVTTANIHVPEASDGVSLENKVFSPMEVLSLG